VPSAKVASEPLAAERSETDLEDGELDQAIEIALRSFPLEGICHCAGLVGAMTGLLYSTFLSACETTEHPA